MATLTFKQIREYQTQLESKYAELETDGLSFKEMRAIQAQIADIYTLLGEDGTEPETTPTATVANLAAQFNDTLKNGHFYDAVYFGYDNCKQLAGVEINLEGIGPFNLKAYNLGAQWRNAGNQRPKAMYLSDNVFAKLEVLLTFDDDKSATAKWDKRSKRWIWDKDVPITEQPTTAPATLFDRLLAGEFNNLPTSSQYMDKLREVDDEADTPKGADFTAEIAEKVAGIIAEYYDTHRSEIHNPAGLNITQQDIDEAA